MKGIWLIILLFIGYLGLVFFEKEDIASYIKPLLVPVLLLSFYASVKQKGNYKRGGEQGRRGTSVLVLGAGQRHPLYICFE